MDVSHYADEKFRPMTLYRSRLGPAIGYIYIYIWPRKQDGSSAGTVSFYSSLLRGAEWTIYADNYCQLREPDGGGGGEVMWQKTNCSPAMPHRVKRRKYTTNEVGGVDRVVSNVPVYI